jgi:hypothetical protein
MIELEKYSQLKNHRGKHNIKCRTETFFSHFGHGERVGKNTQKLEIIIAQSSYKRPAVHTFSDLKELNQIHTQTQSQTI